MRTLRNDCYLLIHFHKKGYKPRQVDAVHLRERIKVKQVLTPDRNLRRSQDECEDSDNEEMTRSAQTSGEEGLSGKYVVAP